jgi:hypothetical protein
MAFDDSLGVGDKVSSEEIGRALNGVSERPASNEQVIAEDTASEEDRNDENQPSIEDIERARKYQYPLDMAPNHPGRIIFTAYKIEGLDIAKKLSGLFKYTKLLRRNSVNNGTFDEDESTAEEQLSDEDKAQIEGEVEQFNKDLQTYENLEGGEPYGSVTLPVPVGIQFNDNATYQGADLGLIAGATEGLMGGEGFSFGDGQLGSAAAAVVAQRLSGLAGEALGAVGGGIAGRFAGSGLIGSGLGAVAAGGALSELPQAVASATRFTPSPNERILFKRANIRKFTFAFKMVAMSEAEAIEIKNIVKFFRTELYPERVNLGEGGGIPLALKFPNVFDIDIRNRAEKNPAFKIQRCYLENVATTFNATSPAMYKGNFFMEVDVQLQFTEVSALHKKRVREGY